MHHPFYTSSESFWKRNVYWEQFYVNVFYRHRRKTWLYQTVVNVYNCRIGSWEGFLSTLPLQKLLLMLKGALVRRSWETNICMKTKQGFTCPESETCCPGLGTAAAIGPPPAPPGWSCGTVSGSCPATPFTWQGFKEKWVIYEWMNEWMNDAFICHWTSIPTQWNYSYNVYQRDDLLSTILRKEMIQVTAGPD